MIVEEPSALCQKRRSTGEALHDPEQMPALRREDLVRRQVPWLVLAAAAALGACATRPSVKLAYLPPDTAQACADWRWIAVLDRPADACPPAREGWEVAKLFRDQRANASKSYAAAASESARATADQREVVEGLAPEQAAAEIGRFCVYQVANPAADARKLPFPPTESPSVGRLDRDCAAFSIAADPQLSGIDWKPVAADFLAQSGKPEVPLDIKNQRGVRLAFIDTQPTNDDFGSVTPPGYSLHGYTLAHIARQLICSPVDSDKCAARITTQLALPLASFDARSRERTRPGAPGQGGNIGTQSDVARAILEEVEAWRMAPDGAAVDQHLVLNLSLAWDPRLFGGVDEAQVASLRAGSQAVYRALQYAASQGALVLAAAGNKKVCPGVPIDGPLLPAGWEAGGPPERRCGPTPSPFVFAVGGLGAPDDEGDHPLWNARTGGMPRLAAFAEHAVVSAGGADSPTAMYTGSSVATAVASSVAAIVWDTVPSLDASGVIKLLNTDTSQNVTSLHADFWPGVGNASLVGVTAPKVHRVTLCDALLAACQHPKASPNCPLPLRECPKIGEPREFSYLKGLGSVPTTCQPWVFPQPEEPPCPTCVKEPPRM